jgi:hypothetical protein
MIIYIYIYIERERERENKIVLVSLSEGAMEGGRKKENVGELNNIETTHLYMNVI